MIDDVYSGGSKKDGDYPLLSEAMAEGFLHPRCKDSFTTYFEGINTPPEKQNPTQEEAQKTAEKSKLEQNKAYARNQSKRMERLSKNSLDKDNQKIYGARAQQWENKANRLSVHKISDVDKAGKSEEKTAKNLKTVGRAIEKPVKSDIIPYECSRNIKKAVKNAFDAEYTAMAEKFGRISTISRVEPLVNGTDYGEFYDYSGVLSIRFANKKDCLSQLAQKAVEMKKAGKWSSAHPMHVLRHEIGHAIQAEHTKNDPLWKNKKQKIFEIMKQLPEFSNKSYKGNYVVSKYAMEDIDEFISECIAESMTKKVRGTAKKVVDIILGVD